MYLSDVLYELKGVKISFAQAVQMTNLLTSSCPTTFTCSPSYDDGCNESDYAAQCCALCFYSICFSAITVCGNWTNNTLSALVEYDSMTYQAASNDGKRFTGRCDYFPKSIYILGAKVHVSLNTI